MPGVTARGVRLSGCIAPVFWPVHSDILAGGHREYWLRGGRGSAKSSFVSLEIVLGLLRDPMANAIVYRRVGATLRESVYEQMIWAVAMLGLERYFRLRLSPLEMEYLPTGQRILFRGADDPGKSKSIKLARGHFGFVWFEELAEFPGMDDIRTIRASLIRGVPGRAATFYTYNPPRSAASWVNAEALVSRPDRLVHSSDYRDVPPGWLGEDFIAEAEALRTANERAYRHMYLGEVTGAGGQVFDNLTLRPLTQEERAAGRAHCGLDFGFAVDPDAFIRVGFDPARGRLWVLDEFCRARTPVEQLAREVRARCGEGVVRCDSADPRMIAQLRERGVKAVPVKKGPGSVAAGVRWLQERAEIVIDPARCPCAAKEFSAYEYTPDGSGGFLAEYPDKNNHLIDAARYAVEEVMRGESKSEKAREVRECW